MNQSEPFDKLLLIGLGVQTYSWSVLDHLRDQEAWCHALLRYLYGAGVQESGQQQHRLSFEDRKHGDLVDSFIEIPGKERTPFKAVRGHSVLPISLSTLVSLASLASCPGSSTPPGLGPRFKQDNKAQCLLFTIKTTTWSNHFCSLLSLVILILVSSVPFKNKHSQLHQGIAESRHSASMTTFYLFDSKSF